MAFLCEELDTVYREQVEDDLVDLLLQFSFSVDSLIHKQPKRFNSHVLLSYQLSSFLIRRAHLI